MKTESTISTINKELISTFASLDAWFDKVSDEGYDPWSLRDVVEHIVTSNYQLLDLLSDGYDYAFAEYTDTPNQRDDEKSFDAMRFALREQLFQCMCMLDEIQHSQNAQYDTKEMTVYDKLSAVVNHLHFHLENLNGIDKVKNELYNEQ